MTATIARRHRNLPDLNELQARLSALPGNRGNQFTENVWQFINQRGKRYTVDFDTVLALSEVYPDWVRNGELIPSRSPNRSGCPSPNRRPSTATQED